MQTLATQRADAASARIGATLRGKWHLDTLLGVGGMAAVYAATHRNGRRGAVKILLDEACTPDMRRRFLREGRIASLVGHDGVVKVLDDGIAEDGSAFLVMELLEGETLLNRAERTSGKLSCDEVLLASDQILDALAAAHDKGVVHRDIKPENLFLTADGRVKLLDFGIAHADEAVPERRRATLAGVAMGTPAFMSPEQAYGRWDLVGPPSDLWSLGATMFSLMTGEFVHDRASALETLVATCTTEPRSLAAALPGAPTLLVEIVDQALQRRLADRWNDARDMQAAVRAAYRRITGEELPRASEPPHPAPISTVRPKPMATARWGGLVAKLASAMAGASH